MGPGVVVGVGVHAHAGPDHLVETVRSLRDTEAQVVLLPDGPDAALTAALAADPALAGRHGLTGPWVSGDG